MKKIRLLPLLAIFLWLSSCRITSAEDPGPPLASAEQITFQNQQVVATSSANGTFDPVTVNPLAPGTYTITAQQVDVAGNVGSQSGPLSPPLS